MIRAAVAAASRAEDAWLTTSEIVPCSRSRLMSLTAAYASVMLVGSGVVTTRQSSAAAAILTTFRRDACAGVYDNNVGGLLESLHLREEAGAVIIGKVGHVCNTAGAGDKVNAVSGGEGYVAQAALSGDDVGKAGGGGQAAQDIEVGKAKVGVDQHDAAADARGGNGELSAMLDLPTPPLPDVTAMTRARERTSAASLRRRVA